MGRPETGTMQFGNDWPGIFIRGDNAAYYAMCLKTHLDHPGEDAFAEANVRCLLDLLSSSTVRIYGDVNLPSGLPVEPQFAVLVSDTEDKLAAHPANE